MTSPSAPVAAPSLWPAVALGLAVAVGNGLGRFAYALLLPAMQHDLVLSYAEAGWLNTANALGYVLGALSSFILLRWTAARTLFVCGLVLCALSLAATGFGRSLLWLTSTRMAAGVGAAWVFSCGGVLVQHLYSHSTRAKGTATGVFFGGAGVGIALSAALVVPVLSHAGDSAWPHAWLTLGAVGALMAVGAIQTARRVELPVRTGAAGPVERLSLKGLHACLLSYFCIAAGYIGYVTFVFAWMRGENHSPLASAGVWALMGSCVAASPWVWSKALNQWPAASTLALSSAATFIGVLLCILDSSVWALLASATLFGLGVFIAPAAVSMLLNRHLPAHLTARAMALFTTVFAVGQALGPLLSGALADRHGLASTLWPGAALLALASVLPLLPLRVSAPRSA